VKHGVLDPDKNYFNCCETYIIKYKNIVNHIFQYMFQPMFDTCFGIYFSYVQHFHHYVMLMLYRLKNVYNAFDCFI